LVSEFKEDKNIKTLASKWFPRKGKRKERR
jgi:hypothetical protein